MTDLFPTTLSQQVAAAVFASSVALLGTKVIMNCYAHLPIKYGQPQPKSAPPSVPGEDSDGFHVSYDGRLWLFERKWEPKGEVKATLRILHGTVDHSGVYDELAQKLAKNGIAVFASDMRGWGLSDGEQLFFNDMETFVEDVRVDHLRVHADPRYRNVKRRFILGKSLGGLIAAHVVARHPALYSGLIGLSGAFEVGSKLPPAPVLLLLRAVAFFFPKLLFKQVFDPKLIVSDAAALRAWELDPLVARGRGTISYFTSIAGGTAELARRIPRMSVPMLMMWGTADAVVSLKGHQDMVRYSAATDSELRQYPGAFHNILAEPACKAQAQEDILQWLLARANAK